MKTTRRTPRWTRRGWIRMNDGGYFNPDVGTIERDAGDWTLNRPHQVPAVFRTLAEAMRGPGKKRLK